MPRGRPPKNRTREEAVNARREQVRKNVQAFRQRKRLQQRLLEPGTASESLDRDQLAEEVDDCVADDEGHVIDGNDHTQHSDESDHDNAVDLRDCNRSMAVWTRLPPEISYPQLSRQQFVSNCIVAFKPESKLNTGPHWTETLPGIVNQDSTLDYSIQALCLLQLGNVTSQRWLLEEGGKYYGQALRTLTRRLPTDKDIREEVFMAMMALSIYELFQCTNVNGQGWLMHYKAAFRYLKQLSQAKKGWIPNNQPVFHFLETLCVFDALGSRRSSYFSTSDAWSRSLDRWGGEIYGPLLGLMTSVPVILEVHDKLLNPSGTVQKPSMPSKSEMLKQCISLEDRFLEWHHDTCSHLPTFTFTLNETLQNDSFLTFPTLFIARLHTLYWSALVLLLDTTASLSQAIQAPSSGSDVNIEPGLDPIMRLPNDTRSKSQQYALWIRQSVTYCLNPEHGVVGKSIVLLPLWIARNHFQGVGDGPEMERCNDTLAALGQRDLHFGFADDVTDEGESLTGVHWREGGLAAFDRGRKELANLGAYCL